MKTVLKKAGIVVAAATAGLLALSPLAFAGDYDGDSDDNGNGNGNGHRGNSASCEQDVSAETGDNKQKGLVNVGANNVTVPVQACGNDVLSGTLGIVAKDNKNSSDDE